MLTAARVALAFNLFRTRNAYCVIAVVPVRKLDLSQRLKYKRNNLLLNIRLGNDRDNVKFSIRYELNRFFCIFRYKISRPVLYFVTRIDPWKQIKLMFRPRFFAFSQGDSSTDEQTFGFWAQILNVYLCFDFWNFRASSKFVIYKFSVSSRVSHWNTNGFLIFF